MGVGHLSHCSRDMELAMPEGGREGEGLEMVPADGCLYRRPFDEYFLECPSYEREPYATVDLRGVPLAMVWTCSNLAIGEYEGNRGHLYARCLLGDIAARRQAVLEKLRGPGAA